MHTMQAVVKIILDSQGLWTARKVHALQSLVEVLPKDKICNLAGGFTPCELWSNTYPKSSDVDLQEDSHATSSHAMQIVRKMPTLQALVERLAKVKRCRLQRDSSYSGRETVLEISTGLMIKRPTPNVIRCSVKKLKTQRSASTEDRCSSLVVT